MTLTELAAVAYTDRIIICDGDYKMEANPETLNENPFIQAYKECKIDNVIPICDDDGCALKVIMNV